MRNGLKIHFSQGTPQQSALILQANDEIQMLFSKWLLVYLNTSNLYNSLNFRTRKTILVSKESSKPIDFNYKFFKSQIVQIGFILWWWVMNVNTSKRVSLLFRLMFVYAVSFWERNPNCGSKYCKRSLVKGGSS